jgi:hypothetical protein
LDGRIANPNAMAAVSPALTASRARHRIVWYDGEATGLAGRGGAMAGRRAAAAAFVGIVWVLSCGGGREELKDAAGMGDATDVPADESRSADADLPVPVCQPGERSCYDDLVCVCNDYGTDWMCWKCEGSKQRCFLGECCTPHYCGWRECGSDGCGGSCGDCGLYATCNEETGACGPPCTEELFTEEVCGQGKTAKSDCGSCPEDVLFECAWDADEGGEENRTLCACRGWEGDGFDCYRQSPPEGHEMCSSALGCPEMPDSSGTLQKAVCVQPCDVHEATFCAAPCDHPSDCLPGHYCDAVGGEPGVCMPDGVWECWHPCTSYPGTLMCSCAAAEECEDLCVPGRQGSFCALTYDEGGCGGYEQLEYMEVGLGPDFWYACVERAVKICLPCQQDEDCLLPWADPGSDYGDRCVSYGEAGSFCGVNCDEKDWGGHPWPCPPGYACQEGQCVAESGTCDCPPYHVELAAATVCQSSNEHGSCSGYRKCTDQGLSACDALTPAPELCDGQDNNCDGAVDEGCP